MRGESEKFAVVYMWRGERHRLLQDFDSKDGALKAVAELKREGFRAWIELL